MKKEGKKPFIRRLFYILSFLIIIAIILEAGVFIKDREKIWKPSYDKVDISGLIFKENLTEQDYALILEQTGLTKTGFDSLMQTANADKVLEIQQNFFADLKYCENQFAPFTCYHELSSPLATAVLENGDIIYSPTTHFSFFELGHSAIVVDAESGVVLNALGYEDKSCLEDVTTATNRPAFMVLRLKKPRETREEIARFAYENLTDLQYSVSIGLIGNKNPDNLTRTNCSHIIWYAYKKFGIETDSNGGPFVFPKDIAASDEFEIVQIYGIDPKSIN